MRRITKSLIWGGLVFWLAYTLGIEITWKLIILLPAVCFIDAVIDMVDDFLRERIGHAKADS